MAEEISLNLSAKLAYDENCCEWYQRLTNVWTKAPENTAVRIIRQELSRQFPEGFSLAFSRNIEAFLKTYLYIDDWETDRSQLPLENGILNIRTMKILPYSSKSRFQWCLPYSYDINAKCPTVMEWLKESTCNDKETIEIIRACFYLALVGSKEVQKCMELIGPGGTGKSTLVRLMIELIGRENHVATDLRNLESNRFESAIIYGKRLAVISDSSRYGGEVSVLKSITGGDPIRLERKNKQQGGSFVADCFVVIASNEPIQSSDYTSGLARRRVPIHFERRVTEADKEKWRNVGGIENAMKKELPGLLNWVLALTESDANRILGGLNGTMTKSQLRHLVETNKFAAWMDENLIIDESTGTYTGVAYTSKTIDSIREIREKLYPNYQNWCEENSIKPVSVRRFGDSLEDTCRMLKLPVKRLEKDRYGRKFLGLAIRDNDIHGKNLITLVTKTRL